MAESSARPEDRLISLGDGTFSIPERLLLAHARGEVLFITGAGTSTPARLPDFRKLVLDVYERVEHSMLATLQTTIPRILSEDWVLPANNFIDDQNAEIKRFALGDYDVVLGMLERRMEREPGADSNVRAAVVDALSKAGSTPTDIHRSLIRLANRGETTTILTTNYDLLLEKAASGSRTKVWSHSLGAIPRPSRRREFGGVLHIHGALPAGCGASSEMVLTDHDFGEYYLRRRVVPDLIYDAARLFHLVLVGYSAKDAPMRYLLNAVAADGTRFRDLKERFVFVAVRRAGLADGPHRDRARAVDEALVMTIIGFSDLPPNEHEPYNLANHFLSGRLEEWATADWALALKPWQNTERAALQDTYLHRASHPLTEPWRTFWGWLLESWTTALPAQHDRVSPYQIGELIRRGDRSGRTINAIVDVVRPYVVISERVSFHGPARKRPKTPRDVGDLAFIRLGSGALPDEGVLGLEKVTEPLFLAELAHALECALMHGLDVARRLPWTGEDGLWRIGELHRVYPAYYMEDPGHRPREPDEHNEGVAPSAKLLFVTVSRLSTLDPAAAQVFLERWRSEDSLVFIRLWAAAARDRALIEADEVAAFLRACDAHPFWDLHIYPEIAEMRARRFADLANKAQMAIVARLKRLPPRAHWPRLPRDKLEEVRLFWAAREFKRIEIAGGALPAAAAAWLVSHTTRFRDIEAMRAIDEGFPQAVEVHGSDTTPDLEYDALSGIARLQAMEYAAAAPGSWSNGPSERARYWLGLPGRFLNLIKDLEATPGGGAAFPNVWDMLGRLHRPDSAITTSDPSAPPEISVRVLALIAQLPEKTMREAVVGLTDWLSAWKKQVIERPELPAVWARLWPFAVAATNARQDECREIDSIQLREGERQDIDTLNNPAGKMIDVFFEACPNLKGVPHPFADNSHLRAMRDAIVAAPGRAGLVAKCRLLEKLAYFLNADAQWTRAQVIPAILEDSAHDAPILWRALAWRTQFGDVIGEIGEAMADRAADLRYARETRKALAFSLVVHMLNAYWEERAPRLPAARVQQMLRACDDEVRAHAAESLTNFVASVARTEEEDADKRQGAAAVFRKAAAPVLTDVWPQERSLSTPGVARALADLPAASGGAFADAVRIIERFLVPFDAWSMSAYGLYGSGDDGLKLNRIDEEKKADAFLTLLDLTIGPQEGATIPSDLGQALQRIGEVAPTLAGDRRFRRLAALSRRWS